MSGFKGFKESWLWFSTNIINDAMNTVLGSKEACRARPSIEINRGAIIYNS